MINKVKCEWNWKIKRIFRKLRKQKVTVKRANTGQMFPPEVTTFLYLAQITNAQSFFQILEVMTFDYIPPIDFTSGIVVDVHRVLWRQVTHFNKQKIRRRKGISRKFQKNCLTKPENNNRFFIYIWNIILILIYFHYTELVLEVCTNEWPTQARDRKKLITIFCNKSVQFSNYMSEFVSGNPSFLHKVNEHSIKFIK